MRQWAVLLGVCFCGGVLPVMGAEEQIAHSGILTQDAIFEEKAGETVPAFKPEDGAQLLAGSQYVRLSAMPGESPLGLYLACDSIRVVDVEKEALLLTAKVYDMRQEGIEESIWQFRMDGDGEMYYKRPDGTYILLPSEGQGAETLAANRIREELGNESKREMFIREIQEIAIKKAHLDTSEDEGKEKEETSAKEDKEVSEKSQSMTTTESKKENIPVDTSSQMNIWNELEKRVKAMGKKGKTSAAEKRTRIEVVVPADPDAVYEEKEAEIKDEKVVVSIESAKSGK